MTEIAVYSDSQGRGITEKIYYLSKKTVVPTGVVLTSAKLVDIIKHAKKSRHEHIVLLGGTIDSLKGTINEIYKYLDENLDSLGSKKLICLLTIPKRHDLLENDPIHEELMMVNNYIVEVAARMNNVKVIDAHSLTRSLHTSHGLHFNTRGKTKVAYLILKAIKKSGKSSISGEKTCSISKSVGILIGNNSFGTSGSAFEPAKESFVDAMSEQEEEEEMVENTFFPDSMRIISSRHSESLEFEPDSSNSSLHLENEQNCSLEEEKHKITENQISKIPELKESFVDSSESLTTQEYCNTSSSTSSIFYETVGSLQTDPQKSTRLTVENISRREKNDFDLRKMKLEILSKKMSKSKYFLPEKKLDSLKKREVKNFVRERGFMKKRLNISTFPIKNSLLSRSGLKPEKLSVNCSMPERDFCFTEENIHEQVGENQEKSGVFMSVNVTKSDLFENPSSFFLTAVMVVAMYLFLTEFFIFDSLY